MMQDYDYFSVNQFKECCFRSMAQMHTAMSDLLALRSSDLICDEKCRELINMIKNAEMFVDEALVSFSKISFSEHPSDYVPDFDVENAYGFISDDPLEGDF